MEYHTDENSRRLVELIDCRFTMKAFEFDQTLLMPTAESYRALIDLAEIEIEPKIMNYLSKKWSKGAIENLSFFVMAVAIYARSILEPPIIIDVGKVLLKTVAACNLRCVKRKETGGGCRASMNLSQHHLPKCIKLPKEISLGWSYVKRYVATEGAICQSYSIGVQEAMSVKIGPKADFSPAASC